MERVPPQAKPHPVLVTTVRDLSSEYERTFTAIVRARYESDQGFRTGGKIIARMAEIGQKVAAGQVLATLFTKNGGQALDIFKQNGLFPID